MHNGNILEPLFYNRNVAYNYKDVTVNVGCKVSDPMTDSQPTDEGISSNIDNAVGKALQNRKHEILQIAQQTNCSLEEVIELSLKNGLEFTAKSVSPGRRWRVLEDEVREE